GLCVLVGIGGVAYRLTPYAPRVVLERTADAFVSPLHLFWLSSDGRHMYTTGLTRLGFDAVQMWDTATGQIEATFLEGLLLRDMEITPDGRYVVACGENLHVVDLLESKEHRNLLDFPIDHQQLSPAGRYVFASGADRSAVLELSTRRVVFSSDIA